MKKTTILGHIFELEDNAYYFLESYIKRIDTYAKDHGIATDVVDDIKYSVIEKLYRVSTPVRESDVIAVAQNIGEPESIFDEGEGENHAATGGVYTNAIEKKYWLDKEKPLIWGVCYWIATSLKIPVRIVRIVAVLSVLLQTAGFWIYLVLALFVPFKEKKRTTGSVGNIVFEIVRIVFWLFILSMLLPAVIVSLTGMGVAMGLPTFDNQSFAALIPSYIYLIGGGIAIAFLILLIGALGALFKKRRIGKTVALLATVMIIGGTVALAGFGFTSVTRLADNEHIHTQQKTFSGVTTSGTTSGTTGAIITTGDSITIITQLADRSNLLDIPLADNNIHVVPYTGNEVIVTVETEMRAMSKSILEDTIAAYNGLIISGNSSAITISSPEESFTKVVPFAFIRRTITISVPNTKEVILNNDKRTSHNLGGRSYDRYEDMYDRDGVLENIHDRLEDHIESRIEEKFNTLDQRFEHIENYRENGGR